MAVTYGQQVYTNSKPMSLEEYLVCNDGTDICHELVDGVLIEMGNESKLNVKISMFLVFYSGFQS
jgi:Uma2 family endonuclease